MVDSCSYLLQVCEQAAPFYLLLLVGFQAGMLLSVDATTLIYFKLQNVVYTTIMCIHHQSSLLPTAVYYFHADSSKEKQTKMTILLRQTSSKCSFSIGASSNTHLCHKTLTPWYKKKKYPHRIASHA
jgi:hypothetical protein